MKHVTALFAATAGLAAGLSMQVIPAQAGVPNVPQDVAAWFRGAGADLVVASSVKTPNAKVDPGDLTFPFGSVVGEPVSVMVWREAFLQADDPTADLLEPRGDWMAPVLAKGKPVGTLTADKSEGTTIDWAMDGDADSAAALWTARPGDIVASDGRSGLFVVVGDTVRQYGPRNWRVGTSAGTLKQLQAALRAQQAEDQAAAEAAGEPVEGGGPILFADFVRSHPETAVEPAGPVLPDPPIAVVTPVVVAAVNPTPWLTAGIVVLGAGLILGVAQWNRRRGMARR